MAFEIFLRFQMRYLRLTPDLSSWQLLLYQKILKLQDGILHKKRIPFWIFIVQFAERPGELDALNSASNPQKEKGG